jgi:NAD-dependent deacetylase
MDAQLKEAAAWIRSAKHLLVFTGAGVSAESGIPTFRDDDGFWREFPPSYFATWNGLLATAILRPRRFAAFVQAVIEPIANARPNAAHIAISAAEQHVTITVVTQNIDGLHQEAGSTSVHEIHGLFLEITTRRGGCRSVIERRELQVISSALKRASLSFFVLPRVMLALRKIIGFSSHGIHYPNLVLFGDLLAEPAWTSALKAARNTDCVVQIGCSGLVWPAATLPDKARAAGARIITINPHKTDGDIWFQGTAAEVVPKLFTAAFGRLDFATPDLWAPQPTVNE